MLCASVTSCDLYISSFIFIYFQRILEWSKTISKDDAPLAIQVTGLTKNKNK